jgi:Polysaccharide pyruvyl transferase
MVETIALLSHRGGNIGHDFMALGIEQAVMIAFGDDVPIVHFEQHRPLDVLRSGHWAQVAFRCNHRFFQLPRKILASDAMRARLWRDVAHMNYRLAVACGGPNLVPGAYKAPEMRMLLHHMNGAFALRGIPLIDAAIGTAFPLERPIKRFDDPQDRTFFRQAASYATRITVRETDAQAALADIGIEAPLLPCAAIGAGKYFECQGSDSATHDGHVVINYQADGANTDWGQGLDKGRWRQIVRGVIDEISRRHPIRMLAHSSYEAKLAGEIAPELPCDHPSDTSDYAKTIANAKAGFVSRIHAAVALAGIGVPSVVVGTDTRLGTATTLGLSTFPSMHATVELLTAAIEGQIARRHQERERLLSLRETTLKDYARIFQDHAK